MTSRGKNFTEREKYKLLELVTKFKHVLENKSTNAASVIQKNEVWDLICLEFNSSAEETRTKKQLQTAYLNSKRSSRQNKTNENVKKYLCHQNVEQPGPSRQTFKDEFNSENDVKCQIKEDVTEDKEGDSTTGGDTYKYNVVLSSFGAKMLSLDDQVTSLSNTCGSASNYYRTDEDSTTPNLQVDTPLTPEPKKKKVIQQNNKKQSHNNNYTIKREYYKKKMECALIEKKTKLLEYKLMLKKQRLLDWEIKIKQKEYENLTNA